MGNTPLLIGGATTSRLHTAVKIAPNYDHPTIHVLDASRSVTVVSSLLDKNLREELCDEVNEQYEELREDYMESLTDRTFLTLQDARKKKPQIDFSEPITRPSFLGTK